MATPNPILILSVQLAVVLALLFFADRWLHRHLQAVMLLISNDQEIATWLYAIVLLPGVMLHELSHALIAKIVGVDIGKVHLLPKRVNNRIQLGFVPVRETDFLRASLIGAAPLLIGGAAIVALGYRIFGTPEVLAALSAGDWIASLDGLRRALQARDAWVWAYLIFAIGNTMLPSRSDTHAWPTLGAILAALAVVVILVGGGALLLQGVGRFLDLAVRWVVLLGMSTLLIDLPFFLLILIVQKMIERLKGVRVEYG